MTFQIILPWPSSKLAGHGNGSWRGKADIIKKHRRDAHYAAMAAHKNKLAIPPDVDIDCIVRFYPPNRRGDRLNYPNRMKPYFDGIASGLSVNDKRFSIPEYLCMEPSKDPKVIVEISLNPLNIGDEG